MSKISYMIESLTRDIVLILMEDNGISMREAMEVIYSSKTYSSLTDPETGLYYQSPVYVYDMLCDELGYKTK